MTTTESAARMTTPTSMPRKSSSAAVRGLQQHQEDRADEDPRGRAHNGDPDIDTHGGYHVLTGDGLTTGPQLEKD